jgi:hypothetical protein
VRLTERNEKEIEIAEIKNLEELKLNQRIKIFKSIQRRDH